MANWITAIATSIIAVLILKRHSGPQEATFNFTTRNPVVARRS